MRAFYSSLAYGGAEDWVWDLSGFRYVSLLV